MECNVKTKNYFETTCTTTLINPIHKKKFSNPYKDYLCRQELPKDFLNKIFINSFKFINL